ncbi:MAG: 6-phosphogluconolactonase [Flavobacteriaceae bacterium]|nr:MAG: 6-phosphogluconolactonase [Flavobacteriaceae bacterium]
MKFKILFIALFIIVSCKEKKKESTVEVVEPIIQKFYLGTYTDGDSKGIYRYALHEDGSLEQIGLASVANNPSFLAKSSDDNYILAVSELDVKGIGFIESFAIKGDSLQSLGKSATGGAHPCHVAINEDGYALASNYTGGNVGLFKLDEKGKLSEVLFIEEHAGQGTTDSQVVSHAHSATFYDGDAKVLVADLGTNEIWFSSLDTNQNSLVPANPQKLKMADGAGPRHTVFHPNKEWLYIVNELNTTVTRAALNEHGGFDKKESISTLPADFEGESFCADIHISGDGKFLYASNRGHNSLAIFGVDEATGVLTLIGTESVKGDWPRNFALSPNDDYVLVANQKSNNIVSFKRDSETGLLVFVAEIEAPAPVCILF